MSRIDLFLSLYPYDGTRLKVLINPEFPYTAELGARATRPHLREAQCCS